ncbi:MAG TPA: hypothetical protein VGH73_22820 [Thermoanaerobaculia bacterium]|jgi:hypothetical protein
MLCPECGGDHEEGSSRCLEGEGEPGRPVEFIPLAEVADAEAFETLALKLEEEGVPWYIQSEPPLGLAHDPGGPVAMIYVAEHRFRRACRALDAVRPVGVEQKF